MPHLHIVTAFRHVTNVVCDKQTITRLSLFSFFAGLGPHAPSTRLPLFPKAISRQPFTHYLHVYYAHGGRQQICLEAPFMLAIPCLPCLPSPAPQVIKHVWRLAL